MLYYWESENNHGKVRANTLEEAKEQIKANDLLIIYHESDTLDGTPFVVDWEAA